MSKPVSSAGAENIRWDLTDLYGDSDLLRTDLEACKHLAEQFAISYKTRVSAFDAEQLVEAMDRLAEIQDRAGRAFTYAYLWWSTDTGDERRGALL
ncbi:MAG: oligoendopeptidase F, partial [Bacteroidetes bacterium]|nr:oligoendopeptidase F [Bacteroidota bacterium]